MDVRVVVRVDPTTRERPPAGADVEVQIRDVSRSDAPSVTLASAHGRLPSGDEPALELTVEVDDDLVDPRASVTVFAQSIADASRGRAKGDWITMESYPVLLEVPDGPPAVEVTLRQIR